MKKQLLFEFTQSLFRKMPFRMAVFAVLTLFSVQTSFAQQWDIIGNEVQIASASTTGTSIVVLNESGNEIPYVAFLENNIPRVKKRGTNGIWTQVGGDIDIALSSSYPYLNIFADANGKLFVSYILNSSKSLAVKTYNAETTNWESLNNNINNKVVSSANGVWVASANFKSPRSYMAFDTSNEMYIAYTADGICNVKKYNKTTNIWESFGNTIALPGTYLVASQKIIFDEVGNLWVGVVTASGTTAALSAAASAGNIKLFKYNAGNNTFEDTASTTNPANSVRELDMALVKGTGQTTSGRIAIAVNNTSDGTRGVVSLYDKVANSWTSANVGYTNKAATYIHIISDDYGNLYCNWVDQTATVATSTCAVKKLNAGTTTPWYEIKNPATVRGVDEPTNNTNLGIASGSTVPYIIYTKANLVANVNTPIVRKYVAPAAGMPVITSFTPALTATTPAPSTAFTITGTNFTGATDVTFGGNPVTSYTVVSATSITGTTSATSVSNFSVSVTTPSGTAIATVPSALSYPTALSTYNGVTFYSTVTATSTLIYSVSPALPAGLSINLGTGTISGTATGYTASTPYTITAANAYGSTTTTVTFASGIPPSAFSYTPVASASYTTGTAITPLVTVITAGTGTPTYAVSPSLPAGFVLNSTTGGISGTPTSVTASTAYTVTATTIYGFTNRVITFSTATPPTWNGTAWSNTTGPTTSLDAIIDGTFSTTANGTIAATKLIINAGKSLTVNSGTNITVQNEVINNGSLVVENNANLIQVLGTTNTNTGNIVVNRNSNALSRLDYTMWASPVASQNLAAFSPLTSQSPSRFYSYDSASNLYSIIASPATTNFMAGAGYLIRMPNNAQTAPATETFTGIFTGVPNNGNVSNTGLTANSFYAVGNPYPSTISADSFLSGNTTDGTLYFWRKTNAASGTAYATYTALGGTGTLAGTNAITPNGTIQVGQGFIVKPTGTTLNFTNAMRTANNGNQNFKTRNIVQKDRVWLNLTNATGVFSQALVGYMTDATQGIDAGIDGAYINDSPVALTSNINNEDYTIQGRALPFDPSDVVALNFKTDVAGDYTIAIDHVDGLFATGQDVFLKDNTTGAETDLKAGAYTFAAAAGPANSRFSLKYQKTLKVNPAVLNDNSVTVYKSKGTLYVNSANVAIANIKVYDVQGRVIAELKNVKSTSASISNLKAANHLLVVKITLQDHKVLTKKVVN